MNTKRFVHKTRAFVSVVLMLFVTFGCTVQESSNLPENMKGLENLTAYPESIFDMEPSMNIELGREVSFGNTDGADLGAIRTISVDERGRVFILDYQQHGIHVFQTDGEYLSFIGGEGSGPGEFRGGSSMRIISNKLYVYDSQMMRVTEIDPDSLFHSEVKSIRPLSQEEIERTTGQTYPSIGEIYVRKDGTLLVEFYPLTITTPSDPRYNLEDERHSQFYIMDYQGRIHSDQLFKLRNRVVIPANVDGHRRFNAAHIYEFLGKPLIAISDDDYIYTAWTEDFLIRIFRPDGGYKRTFHYPHERKRLERHEAIRNVKDFGGGEYYLGWVQHADLPETWPVLNYMVVDDEHQLWVSTTAEDYELLDWWVLDDYGRLQATFTWPRNRIVEEVKNGFLYARETERETGLQKIVRYRIVME